MVVSIGYVNAIVEIYVLFLVVFYEIINEKTYSCGCQSSPLVDLTGQSFGEWKVLKLNKEKSKNQHAYWICQCSCGTIHSIEGRTLRNFHS